MFRARLEQEYLLISTEGESEVWLQGDAADPRYKSIKILKGTDLCTLRARTGRNLLQEVFQPPKFRWRLLLITRRVDRSSLSVFAADPGYEGTQNSLGRRKRLFSRV